MQNVFSKKVVIPLLVFIGVVLVWSGFSLWRRSSVEDQLDIAIRGPQQIFLGVPFDLNINIANKSKTVLEESRLTVTLPEGAVFIGSGDQNPTQFADLGSIGSGGVVNETFRVMMLDGENTIRRVEAALSYLPASIGAHFQKNAEFDISVGRQALSLDIVTPQRILSGEGFEASVSYKNNADVEFSDLTLRLEYPPTLTFETSTLDPDENNNIWKLGSLRPGSGNDFTIGANLFGPDNSFFEIRGFIETTIGGQTYTISDGVATITVSPSPLALQIFLNESIDYITETNDRLEYTLIYTNNTDVGLRDVIITAQLIGEMFDLSSLRGTGVFRSIDNTMRWNAATNPELGLIRANESGSVRFTVRTKDTYPIRRLGDRDFTVKVAAQIESPTVPYFLAADRTVGLASIENKVRGDIDIQSIGLFRDAENGVVNQGPWPPKANLPTQFSVHWVITNFSTDVSEVEVRSILEGDTRFLRVVKTNTDSVPTYNPRTQEIVWRIDSIGATRGVITEPIEAIFQIETVPSTNLIGKRAPLIQETTIRAIDDFTGLILEDNDDDFGTNLPEDPTTRSSDGDVTP